MALPIVAPNEAQRLIAEGAVLIDVREADEFAREQIPGARHVALSRFDPALLAASSGKTIIFHCRSGARTLGNAPRLAAWVDSSCRAYILEGGIDAWRRAGLPVVTDASRPIDLQRQVQIGAGSLAFFGTLLGLLVSPWFFAVPLFVGAGLMTAGITGFCGMGRLLVHAPWNRAMIGHATS
jgi:rhodanese-related sulfurtransferase